MRCKALFAIVLLCACSSSPESGDAASAVTLAVAPAAASAGDSVVLTLRNDSEAQIGYNLCTSELHRSTGGEWQSVPSDRVCTMELRTLAPQAEDRYTLELPSRLEPGEYRYHTRVHIPVTGMPSDIQSESFQVRP